MGKSQYDIEVLCRKYIDRSISEEEVVEMLDYFKDHGIPEEFDHLLRKEFSNTIAHSPSRDVEDLTDKVKLKLKKHIASKKKSDLYRWLPYVAAVFISGMIAISWFIFSPKADDTVVSEIDIMPGGNKAKITLADGRILTLDESRDGIVVDGQEITYNDGTSTVLALESSSPQWLALSTPRGGTYKVTLADGTTVWLNAESTLKYPTHFAKGERVVELEGEAYFDVKRVQTDNQAAQFKPFKVVSANQTITVLGTEFNISAYRDEEETKTTLVDGKVRVATRRSGEDMTLLPGEQGKNGKNGLEKYKVDVYDYIDWKNGEFVFRNETAKEVLQRIARWYDIAIDYRGYVPSDEVFSGSISRNSNLQTVLNILREAGDVIFEVKDRTVAVRNKVKNAIQ
ncbi:FecR domain-containing protein [Sphingobacterium sp. DN00404]|uniref:FecR domain-containing protein n=1 Tax=Sphingobacterium micropteri TaxID=2763501 RepID=A0ABR7YP47_9SPHI|nr:FecR family protein [Sphingobacterium micropteri]MBD1433087.1 FecR domain-containing protein [Sphingobacterium micropteri]